MTKFDAIIKMAEISCIGTCKGCIENISFCGNKNRCMWHKVRNETLRRMSFYFNVSPFDLVPKKLFELADKIADAIVFDGEHFPLVFRSSEMGKKSAIRDCRRQFEKIIRS